MSDSFLLKRFIEAQNDIYEDVVRELKQGRKRTHWMWFIFPQVAGLGRSVIAEKFAIRSKEEANAYLDHPQLGKRLRECTELVVNTSGRTAGEIFGYPDDLKFRSSMTLFKQVAKDKTIFSGAIVKFFYGKEDQLTIDILSKWQQQPG